MVRWFGKGSGGFWKGSAKVHTPVSLFLCAALGSSSWTSPKSADLTVISHTGRSLRLREEFVSGVLASVNSQTPAQVELLVRLLLLWRLSYRLSRCHFSLVVVVVTKRISLTAMVSRQV